MAASAVEEFGEHHARREVANSCFIPVVYVRSLLQARKRHLRQIKNNLPRRKYRPGSHGQLSKTLRQVQACAARLSNSPILSSLFRPDALAFLGYGALHERHQNNERRPQSRAHPEDVEVGERCGLLLAEGGER